MDADALMHPRGPLPPVVYWRRRVITLAAALLVLLAVLKACGGDGKDSLTATPGTTSRSPAASAPAKTTAPAPSTSAKPATSPSPSPSPTGRPEGQPCRDTDIEVSATANAKEYAAGARPRLTLVVKNRAPVSCTRDLGAAARELRVVSGSDRVWSSDDCSPGGDAEVVTIPAGGSRSFPVTWSRTRSKPGCPAGREPVAPGTYRVVGRLGSIERPGDVFALRA